MIKPLDVKIKKFMKQAKDKDTQEAKMKKQIVTTTALNTKLQKELRDKKEENEIFLKKVVVEQKAAEINKMKTFKIKQSLKSTIRKQITRQKENIHKAFYMFKLNALYHKFNEKNMLQAEKWNKFAKKEEVKVRIQAFLNK